MATDVLPESWAQGPYNLAPFLVHFLVFKNQGFWAHLHAGGWVLPQTPKSLHYGTWGGFNYLKKQALAGHRAQIDNTSVAAWPLAILKDIQRACGHRCAPKVTLQLGTVFFSVSKNHVV